MTIARRRQKAKIIGFARVTGRGLGLEIDSKDDNTVGLTSFLVRGQTDRSRSVCLVNPSPIGEQSIVMSVSVCLCLSVCDHIFGTSCPIFTNFFMRVTYGRGSVLLWRCHDVTYFRFYG